MPTGDDCLTLQLHGHLDDVTLRVPSGHAGAAADEGLLRGAVQAWAARSRQSETELLADFATVRGDTGGSFESTQPTTFSSSWYGFWLSFFTK